MKIRELPKFWRRHGRSVWLGLLGLVAVLGLLTYKLGILNDGVSAGEYQVAKTPVGWHGLYNQPFYLPLQLVRSVVYYIFPRHGAFDSRFPSVLFGLVAVVSFIVLLRLWHGSRTAAMGGLLFTASAWLLHISRLAANDAVYLAALPLLLAVYALLQRKATNQWLIYAACLSWDLILTVPGLVWLLVWSLIWQRAALKTAWQSLKTIWQKLLAIVLALVWVPVLVVDLLHRLGDWRLWLGLPAHLAGPMQLLRNLGNVFVNLFAHGPNDPQRWLGQTPLLSVFALAMCAIGIYFYLRHWRSSRVRLLGGFLALGAALIALGGPVGLSLLVPLLYVLAATGITYFLHEWLRVFPLNPLARGLGIGLVAVAVGVSCLYNLRSYFVAWPHNPATEATFNRHL